MKNVAVVNQINDLNEVFTLLSSAKIYASFGDVKNEEQSVNTQLVIMTETDFLAYTSEIPQSWKVIVTYHYPEGNNQIPLTDERENSEWVIKMQNLFRTYALNPSGIRLLNIEEVLLNPCRTIRALASEFALNVADEDLKSNQIKRKKSEFWLDYAQKSLINSNNSSQEEYVELLQATNGLIVKDEEITNNRSERYIGAAIQVLKEDRSYLEKKVDDLKFENKACLSDLDSIKKDLKINERKCDEYRIKVSSLEADRSLYKDKYQTTLAELDNYVSITQEMADLSSLQLQQLQEELELYYEKYIELERGIIDFKIKADLTSTPLNNERIRSIKLMALLC